MVMKYVIGLFIFISAITKIDQSIWQFMFLRMNTEGLPFFVHTWTIIEFLFQCLNGAMTSTTRSRRSGKLKIWFDYNGVFICCSFIHHRSEDDNPNWKVKFSYSPHFMVFFRFITNFLKNVEHIKIFRIDHVDYSSFQARILQEREIKLCFYFLSEP